jgi:hypothetical protein
MANQDNQIEPRTAPLQVADADAPKAPVGRYVAPRIVTHSAAELVAKAPAVNACGSYVLVDEL